MLSAVLLGASTTSYTLMGGMALSSGRSVSVRMEDIVDVPVSWNDPREGKPFGEADGPNRPIGKVRRAVESFQPRAISDATIPKPQYIETDDEPWHSTSKQSIVITPTQLTQAFESTLPFYAAEEALAAACATAEDAKAVEKAVAVAKKEGARDGCPAIKDAEKVIAAFKKDAESGLKARPKAKKAGAQGAGWDGMTRSIAVTHDNSI